MEQIDTLRRLGLFDSRVPRYTSYPTAPVFSPCTGSAYQADALAALDPAEPVSVYVHIPFCQRLCWFCACRTQGTNSLSPVEAYIGTLEREITLLAQTLPEGLRLGRLHWGGGTPTILPPPLIHRLAQALKAAIPPAENWEFSVEIDPTMVNIEKINALAAEGMNRASIGIQDFDLRVQQAIGRVQPYQVTKACVDNLRAAGVASLNADLVYGLPHQDMGRIEDTVSKVISLEPDRIALFGYAHVPWVAKRQKLIKDEWLPDDLARYQLSDRAGKMFESAGLMAVGIDHFARPGDELQTAAASGRLRRNFQGYTADHCATLIGLGASSISRLPTGYVQNAAATPAYIERIEAGGFAGARGHIMTDDDLMRAEVIERLMCDFALDRKALEARFGALAGTLDPTFIEISERYGDLVEVTADRLNVRPAGHPLMRIIASAFDAHVQGEVQYSRAS